MLFLAARLRAQSPRMPEPRNFSREQTAAWIAEDEAEMERFREGKWGCFSTPAFCPCSNLVCFWSENARLGDWNSPVSRWPGSRRPPTTPTLPPPLGMNQERSDYTPK